MSFLNNNESEYLAARITAKGRQKIAEGDFNVVYFQLGDSEFDYNFSNYDGSGANVRPAQRIFTPLDRDSVVKYPYKLSESTVTGTTFGNPIQVAQIDTIRNVMGPAGFVSSYDPNYCATTIECPTCEIPMSSISGTTTLYVTGNTFMNCTYVTIAYTRLVGEYYALSGYSNSSVFRVTNIVTGSTYQTLTLDRATPNFTSYTGRTVTVINNKCNPFFPGEYNVDLTCLPNTQNDEDQQDPWTLNIVWSTRPAGIDVPDANVDERVSGYTSNMFVSTKEFFGYNISSGQTTNTGTTITNSAGEKIIVLPEEQHSLAIVHYSELGDDRQPDKFFKYEDYISHDNDGTPGHSLVDDYNGYPLSDTEYFEVYIPFLMYHRNTGTTIGAKFNMGTTDHYVDSTAMDTKLNKIKYRYLIDEQSNNVGKVFVNHKTIVFDDQEIVAALDYKSNRRHTLPVPKLTQVATDTKCNTNGDVIEPLMSGTTGQTVYISYVFEYTGNTKLNGLHLNHYTKITGTSLNADVSMKFGDDDFKFMKNATSKINEGFIANKFSVLVQRVNDGGQPTSDGWRVLDFTDEIPNHTVGNVIDPTNMNGARFIVTSDVIVSGTRYDLESYLGNFPNQSEALANPTLPEFGDEQPFPGSIRLVRATDLHVMRFLINLPDGEFSTTQNPTYKSGPKRISEIALLNDNKDILVIAKTPKPIIRFGTQVFAVKIDI